MVEFLKTIFYILIIIIAAAVLFYVIMLFAFASASKPNNTSESVSKLKLFLGIDFGDQYTELLHNSRNNHPDRPLNISIELSEANFEKVKNFISEVMLERVSYLSKDKTVRYSESWEKDGSSYRKGYKASHINESGSDYTFFYADLSINTETRILSYEELGM